jgi:hypothetical protein
MTENHKDILRLMHGKPLVFCALRQGCAFATLSKSLRDPSGTVWGDRNFATVAVGIDKEKKFDWRFHLGFGQRFSYDLDCPDHYYCIGFLYGGVSRGKSMIAFEVDDGARFERTGKRRRSTFDGESSRIRHYSTNQLVPVDIPKVVGDILSARESTQRDFFDAVRQLFSFGSSLPEVTHFDQQQVSYSIFLDRAVANISYIRF